MTSDWKYLNDCFWFDQQLRNAFVNLQAAILRNERVKCALEYVWSEYCILFDSMAVVASFLIAKSSFAAISVLYVHHGLIMNA